ncbi:UNVERIFIED_CONTAM: hypothetical protein PYX00_010787 [Menopon gallinae]|uniref:Ig-like domain-containing protein n=1 Tax=Menopon gallinae TaxID=328185 RepID=A0AAW2HHQ1_9NEOP
MSTVVFPVLFLTSIFASVAWKSTKEIMESENLEEEFEVATFCKKKEILIRLERNVEFYPVDTVVNSSISMQCKFCEEQDNGLPKNWNYQKHVFTGNVTEVELSMNRDLTFSRIFVTKRHSLIIRNIREEDMGLYFCKAPFVDKLEKSFNYLVDIMNQTVDDIRGDIQIWKNYSDYFFQPLNKIFTAQKVTIHNNAKVNLILFTDWSEWSECDACSSSATRSRVGRCRVKPVCEDPKKCLARSIFNETYFDEKHNTEQNEYDWERIGLGYILQFSIALSCKGMLLKTFLPKVYTYTANVPDFILWSNCTGVCKGRTSSKLVKYKRSIILSQGAHLTLVCPDSTIDSEVRWEHNKLRLYTNEGFDYVEGSEEPRIYVDSFNTLYLFEVTESESGNYTCFVDGFRMQEVKVTVLKRSVFFTKGQLYFINLLGD